MANKKVFTDESLATLISEIKTYIDERVASLASQVAYIDENDDSTVELSVDLERLSYLVGGDE